jgi:diacylglycerol kinase family enzyme
MVFIGNCRYQPPGFAPSWRPRLDDGVLDIRLVDAAPAWARLRLIPAVLTGRLAKCASYKQWQASELRVELGKTEMRLGRDGQTFDGDGAFTVHKRPERLLVYAPHA